MFATCLVYDSMHCESMPIYPDSYLAEGPRGFRQARVLLRDFEDPHELPQ